MKYFSSCSNENKYFHDAIVNSMDELIKKSQTNMVKILRDIDDRLS